MTCLAKHYQVREIRRLLDYSTQTDHSLTDAFTQAGCTLYSLAVNQLIEAHSSVGKHIDEYHSESSRILEAHTELYSNIEWPLSRTQCSSEAHPKATVEAHLNRLAKELASAEAQLKTLAQE